MSNKTVKDKGTSVFNPISLGFLFFGFAASIWGVGDISPGTNLIAWITLVFSFLLGIATLCLPVKRWMQRHIHPKLFIIAPGVFILFLFSILIGWINGLNQVADSEFFALFIAGFVWIFIFIMVMSSQIRQHNKVLGTIMAGALIIIGIYELIMDSFGEIGWWSASILFVFGISEYLVTYGYWKIFDEFTLEIV